MSQHLVVLTEAPGSTSPPEIIHLDLPAPRMRLRDLIASKVRAEIASLADRARGFEPCRAPGPIDPESETGKALQAFAAGRLFAVVDGKQVSSLDAEVDVATASEVRFVRLVPLVGG